MSAFLVDVYDTLVSCDFGARQIGLAKVAGVDPDRFGRELMPLLPDLDRGLCSIDEALTKALAACGTTPRDGLFEDFRRVYTEDAGLFPDALPFLLQSRARGIPVALVSNCTFDTRPMLERLGVLDLVDADVLSCELGYAKPSPEIYQAALGRLNVPASEAVFVDDQLRYCDGAVAVGLTAVQIRRGEPAAPGVIGSLLELLTAG
ncbi:MAG: HAD-IA family hydrolase [Streptosporangiaceae bacterium]|jgi:putative hydrolase of the HAD superfamily